MLGAQPKSQLHKRTEWCKSYSLAPRKTSGTPSITTPSTAACPRLTLPSTHPALDSLCPHSLYGRVALVTGGRVKIGFRIVLKLLRCGCEVIASTRFPIDAVRRYKAEEDSETWQHRLHVVGADLRDLKGLEALCDALPQLVRRLDLIINNACQTVRRHASHRHASHRHASRRRMLPHTGH